MLIHGSHELVLFCLIIPCVHCLFMFYFYKKRKWLFWFCVHQHQSMQSDRTINRSDCNRSMYMHWMQTQILSSFLQWHLATKTSIFLLLVFVCLLFLYRVEMATLVLCIVHRDRYLFLINRSIEIDQSIGCYKSSIRVDYKVRSRVVFSGKI